MKRRPSAVYAILDTAIVRGRDPAGLAASAARGGVTVIQVRAKDASTRAFLRLAEAVREGLSGTGVPIVINDRVDIALAVRADGVHVGRDDMDVATVRALLGPDRIIGATIKSASDVDELVVAGADYGCIGGVFATRHKDNPDPPVGLDGFRTLRQRVARDVPGLPTGAIAGIDASNAGALAAAGADFVAVVGAVFDTDDVEAATRALLAAYQGGMRRS